MSVVVGFSGGVDSSATLAWAKLGGLDPVACVLVMRGGEESIPSHATRERARRTAELLDVPYVERDIAEAFDARVVEPFARAYAEGRTPNPCTMCNRALKVESLIELADELGAERVLTGHYARIIRGEDGVSRIARAADPSKDQSYFLARLTPAQVARLEFPLASVMKDEVRARARELSLPAADARDSVGVCFVEAGTYRDIVAERAPEALEAGEIVTEDGECLGSHHGIASVTVGQRKGLFLSGGPWFVTSIDPKTRRVTVVHGRAPRARSLEVDHLTLNVPEHALDDLEVRVATHYRTEALPARVHLEGGGRAQVAFGERYPLAAPGQSAVLYCDDVVIGEGTITEADFAFREGEGQ